MGDVAYYRRRLKEERKLAKSATDPAAAKGHEQVAALYQKMIDAFEPPEHGPAQATATKSNDAAG